VAHLPEISIVVFFQRSLLQVERFQMTLAVLIVRGLAPALLALIAFGAAVSARGAEDDRDGAPRPEAKALTICATPASMPRSDRAADGTPRGIDVAVARGVGRILGRTIEFHWCASADCAWHCLPEGRCDVVIGQPQGSGPARGVAWSVPYAGAQFGLVVRRDEREVGALADLRGKRVGIVTGTVPLAESDYKVARFKTREELLGGFASGNLEAAFVDADFAAWYLHERPQLGLRLVAEYIPRERWNMALAVRANDSQLLIEINRALAQLTESGELRTIYDGVGVPLRPQFEPSDRPRAASNTWQRIRDRQELVVSIDPANLPYSSANDDRPGFDVELARALAGRLGIKLRLDWLDVQHETAVGQLLESRCDLVLGEAVAANAVADDLALAGKVIYSRPYYGTGYMLVRRKNGPSVRSLAELKGAKSERLGTEAGSVADYSLRQRGYLRRLYRNQLAALKALNDGDVDYAYLWANVGWTVHVSPDLNVELVQNDAPLDRWNIAVAMRPGDDELKRHVDEALGALLADGTVARALARYSMPVIAPVLEPEGGAHGNAGALLRHEVANRGTEPRMQKIQTSKHAYSGLTRIRSAGELVVGLDQNNLPFSTAHPRPEGLDYEIAGLLAKELGVRLRVFWAISAHDSYPSKLAAKGLCDVILGVMPDDRFAQRVLYSRPYYRATYQRVIRAPDRSTSDRGPWAVEEGIAVRGLRGRAVRFFPSTEAILEAVATARVGTGYVISTRGHWLAHERWPDKLTFLPAEENADCFPICAAVRKSDGDLKEAIDRAWDVLDGSSQFGEVFARWHVPQQLVAVAETRKGPVP
jgi:polar amino acid transport system substrate-binding protein